MFKFKNKNHFMNTCRKFLRESYYIYNCDLTTKQLLKIADRVWNFCNEDDYMDYCNQHGICPATNKFSMDIRYAETDEDFTKILAKVEVYFRNPKFNEEFETYSNIICIDFLHKKYGVYKLFDRNKKLVYIGKSINLGGRLAGSLKERKCLFFSFALLDNKSDVSVYEAYYISRYKPEFNSDGKYEDELTVELPELEFSEIFDLRDFVKNKEVIDCCNED